MKKQLYIPLLILAALIGLLSVPALAANVLASGDCGATGNDVTWTLDREGLLTISGTGAMNDYEAAEDVPWHSYLTQIKSLVVNEGVTSVGRNALQSCVNLASVKLPEKGLTSIGDVAFYHCDALTAVTLPESVERIGENAFGFCALATFKIPASVKEIGESAFYKCVALTEITVDEKNAAYSAADGILFDHDKTVLIWYPAKKSAAGYTLPTTVRRIGNYAFHNGSALKKVTFPTVENGGLTEIGSYAFAYSVVSELTIPVSLTTVEDYAFYECTGLSDDDGRPVVDAEGKPVSIVNYGGNRQQWTALIMGAGNYRLTNSNIVFGDMKQDNVIASGECGTLGNNASWSLNKDGEFLISGKGSMKDYRDAESVPWAAYKAADADPKILKVTVAEGITNLGDYAFYDCDKLTEVHLPATLERIGSTDAAYSRAFSDCVALTTLNLPDTAVKSIGNYAFNGCAALASVTFPDTLLTIGARAFLNCTALKEITIPLSVTSVGEWAFRGCAGLTSFVMEPLSRNAEPHYTSLGAYVLADCAALETVSFTENLTVLGDYALTKCEKLKEIALPASVSGIGNCAFLSCPALASVEVNERNQTYCIMNSMLMNNDQTYILYYPAGRNSTACSIPESVTSVAAFAFQDAKLLTDVYYQGSRKQWNNDVAPNIGRPNDPLFAILESEDHFKCEGTDPDEEDPSSIDLFTAQPTGESWTATAKVHCGQNALGAFAVCAMYDKEGQFLGIASGRIVEESEEPDSGNSESGNSGGNSESGNSGGGNSESGNSGGGNSESGNSGGNSENEEPNSENPDDEPQVAQIPAMNVPGDDYNLSFTLDSEAATLYLFVLDGDNRPQCQRGVCRIEAEQEEEAAE